MPVSSPHGLLGGRRAYACAKISGLPGSDTAMPDAQRLAVACGTPGAPCVGYLMRTPEQQRVAGTVAGAAWGGLA